jgi:hypothetical protein
LFYSLDNLTFGVFSDPQFINICGCFNNIAMENLLKKFLAKYKVGQTLNSEDNKALLAQCLNIPAFKTCASKEGALLEVRSLIIAGQKGRYICFSGQEYPITQVKLYPRKKQSAVCKHCGLASCKRAKVIAAFRLSIKEQIEEFREEIKAKVNSLLATDVIKDQIAARKLLSCPLTGKFLGTAKTHVDHVKPFKQLLEDFCSEYNLKLCCVKLNRKGMFADTALQASWQSWHKEKAILQITSAKGNLQKGSR